MAGTGALGGDSGRSFVSAWSVGFGVCESFGSFEKSMFHPSEGGFETRSYSRLTRPRKRQNVLSHRRPLSDFSGALSSEEHHGRGLDQIEQLSQHAQTELAAVALPISWSSSESSFSVPKGWSSEHEPPGQGPLLDDLGAVVGLDRLDRLQVVQYARVDAGMHHGRVLAVVAGSKALWRRRAVWSFRSQ